MDKHGRRNGYSDTVAMRRLFPDGHGGRYCERDAALVRRQVLPLLRCNWQDHVFRPIARDQKVLLINRTQTNEREFAAVARTTLRPLAHRLSIGG